MKFSGSGQLLSNIRGLRVILLSICKWIVAHLVFQKMPRQQERAGCAEKQRHCKNAAITILVRTRGFMNAYRLAARLQTKLCILLQPLEDARHEPAKSERTLKHWNPQTSELTHDKYIDSYNAAIFPAKRVEMSWTYLNVSYTMQSMHACLHQTGKQSTQNIKWSNMTVMLYTQLVYTQAYSILIQIKVSGTSALSACRQGSTAALNRLAYSEDSYPDSMRKLPRLTIRPNRG